MYGVVTGQRSPSKQGPGVCGAQEVQRVRVTTFLPDNPGPRPQAHSRALGHLCRVASGDCPVWKRSDGNDGRLRLAGHFQLIQRPWTHRPVQTKAANPSEQRRIRLFRDLAKGPSKAFPLCFLKHLTTFLRPPDQTGAPSSPPLGRPLTLIASLCSTLVCPSSQSVSNSFCCRALALAFSQLATLPPGSPQPSAHMSPPWEGKERAVPATSSFFVFTARILR